MTVFLAPRPASVALPRAVPDAVEVVAQRLRDAHDVIRKVLGVALHEVARARVPRARAQSQRRPLMILIETYQLTSVSSPVVFLLSSAQWPPRDHCDRIDAGIRVQFSSSSHATCTSRARARGVKCGLGRGTRTRGEKPAYSRRETRASLVPQFARLKMCAYYQHGCRLADRQAETK